MHSTYWYRLSLDKHAPSEGPDLLQHCTDIWLDEYQRILDENNWFQPLFCAEKDGASVAHSDVKGEPRGFDESCHSALLSVLYDLAMYARSSGADFLDINPLSIGPRGQDETLAQEMDSKELTDLMLRQGAEYLHRCYHRLSEHPLPDDKLDLADYQRSAFARRYELFRGSSSRPFSDEYPSPYVYSAADLRSYGATREAILAVDIHT